MGVQQREPPASVVAFAPKRAGQERAEKDRRVPADDAGNGIIALLHKAAEAAKEDCARAMNLAHKLSSQLRAAEERSRELEARQITFGSVPLPRRNGSLSHATRTPSRFAAMASRKARASGVAASRSAVRTISIGRR